MNHKEGGWPKEVDHSEIIDTNRHRKKIEKDPSNKIIHCTSYLFRFILGFAFAVRDMTDNVEKCI